MIISRQNILGVMRSCLVFNVTIYSDIFCGLWLMVIDQSNQNTSLILDQFSKPLTNGHSLI